MSRRRAEDVGWTVGTVMFLIVFLGGLKISVDKWNTIIRQKAHQPSWHLVMSRVDRVGVGVPGDQPVELSYIGLTGIRHTALVTLTHSNKHPYKVGDQLKTWINTKKEDQKTTHIWFNKLDTDLYPINNPFKAYPGFYPVASILCGIILAMLAGIAIGFWVLDFLLWFYSPVRQRRRRPPTLWGMQTLPTPTEKVLVHTPDGRIIEKVIRKYN